METTMSFPSRKSAKLASTATFVLSAGGLFAGVLLAGCAQQSQPVVTSYNPPGAALAQLPPGNVTWYHVMFANGSTQIDASGQQAINSAAASMQGNSALVATVIGKTDSAGSAAANMRLSQQRASAVRTALLQTGMVPAQQIETRWTGERQQGAQTTSDVADPSNRAVDIGVH
jgi:outer membrane protein OmpA-like peptidoglycan-associated protein